MDWPCLPPWPYNSRVDRERRDRKAQVRHLLRTAGVKPDPEPEPCERELRWQAEDAWLIDQWTLGYG